MTNTINQTLKTPNPKISSRCTRRVSNLTIDPSGLVRAAHTAAYGGAIAESHQRDRGADAFCGGYRKLIAETEVADVCGRAGWPDRIGAVQHPVWAKNVVARPIAIDDAGLVRPKLSPDLDPETRSCRSPLAGELVGRGDEARRFVADRSKLLRARAGRRGRQSRGRHTGEGQ